MTKYKNLKMTLLGESFIYCKYKTNSYHKIIGYEGYNIIIIDSDELTLITNRKELIPDGLVKNEKGWALFKIIGEMEFGSVQGLIALITNRFKEKDIGSCVISTFSTDYFLIKSIYLPTAKKVLAEMDFS